MHVTGTHIDRYPHMHTYIPLENLDKTLWVFSEWGPTQLGVVWGIMGLGVPFYTFWHCLNISGDYNSTFKIRRRGVFFLFIK